MQTVTCKDPLVPIHVRRFAYGPVVSKPCQSCMILLSCRSLQLGHDASAAAHDVVNVYTLRSVSDMILMMSISTQAVVSRLHTKLM